MDSEVQVNINSNEKTYQVPDAVPAGIFRAYDIRGEVSPSGLTPDVAYAIGLAIGSEANEQQINRVIGGRDGRLSAIDLTTALCRGLLDTGCDVIDVGRVPTPLVYFATNRLSTNTGVMVTASHNPAHHNGFKIVMNGQTLKSESIQSLFLRIDERRFVCGKGTYSMADIVTDYHQFVTQQVTLDRPLKVVVDCGNGIAGEIVPNLYRALGCDVIELFCDVDGRFPNHHPDPTVPENLTGLINNVKTQQADIGLAFDGDADRLGVVTNTGKIIWPDRLMMLFSKDLLQRLPGAEIIFDVKCSRNLAEVIRQQGGRPTMYRTGHSILKAKMMETAAPLAGEMSGHIFFKEDWFGFDDGIYVGARLLRILSQEGRTSNDVFSDLPDSVNTPELKLPMPESEKDAFMERLLSEADFGSAERITIDGLRVDFGYGWGLVRPSNTSPYLILRFEADTPEHLDQIKEQFRQQLLRLDRTLKLPF